MVFKEVRRYVRELRLDPVTKVDVENAATAIAGAINPLGEREGLKGIRMDANRGGRKVIRLDFSKHEQAKRLFTAIRNLDTSRSVALGLFPDERERLANEAAMRKVVIAPDNRAGKLLIARLRDELENHPRWMVARKPAKR